MALSRQQAQVDLLPAVQQNKAAQAQAAVDARNKATTMRGVYDALAGLQAGQAAQVGGIYQNAADSQAAYGKGFSTNLQGTLDQSAAQSNALLAQNGAPAGQQIHPGSGAADVLYALGGYSPASVLNQAGAAFQASAAQLPSTSRGLGVEAYRGALNEGTVAKQKLLADLADIQAKRPGLVQQALSGLQSNQQQNYANAIQANYLNNTLRNTTANLTGVDPVTNQPTAAAQHAQAVIDAKQNAVQTAAQTKAANRHSAAVSKRNDATVKSLVNGRDWVEAQLKPGYTPEKVADVPIKVGTKPGVTLKGENGASVKIPSKPIYAAKGGGTTTDISQAATKAVFSQQPIPKPQYQKLLRQLTGRISTELGRYGYKPKEIRAFVVDILNDYYVPVQHPAPKPRVTKNSTGGTTTTYGP